MLGLGGAGLYIPILYWMGLDFKTEAIPLGMLLNVINSATAATTYTIKKMSLVSGFAVCRYHAVFQQLEHG